MPRLAAECVCGEARTFDSRSSQALAPAWAKEHMRNGSDGCDHVVDLFFIQETKS